jgi:TetR/AcrR family transcriptional regulator
MPKAMLASSKSLPKRRQGRPQQNTVGRERLIDAARTLLRTHPPAAISRLDVAEVAGVDPGLIRYYFGNKDRLMAEAVELIATEIRSCSTAIDDKTKSPRERLTQFVYEFALLNSRNPNYHQLVMDQIMNAKNARAKRLRHEMTHSLADKLRDVLDDGVRSGDFRVADARLLAIAVIGISEFFGSGFGVVNELYPGADREKLAETYAQFVAGLMDSALAPAARPPGRRRPK